jgi:hypothetical protein
MPQQNVENTQLGGVEIGRASKRDSETIISGITFRKAAQSGPLCFGSSFISDW